MGTECKNKNGLTLSPEDTSCYTLTHWEDLHTLEKPTLTIIALYLAFSKGIWLWYHKINLPG